MPRYVIERESPGAGAMTDEQSKSVTAASCGVLRDLGPGIRWIESYVTDNKVFCIYEAESEALIRKHAELGGFPCNAVREVKRVMTPNPAG